MGEEEDQRAQKLVLQRLRDMGLRAEAWAGGRAVVAELPLRPAPFPGLDGPLDFATAQFVTVGPTQIKCLKPLPLFHLPLISIAGCNHPDMIEDRIRAAWAAQGEALRATKTAFEEIGASVESEAQGALLSVGLGLDDTEARARCLEHDRFVLPGRGPLSGLPVSRARERLFTPGADCESGTDLEIAITNRMETLARDWRRTADEAWVARAHSEPAESARLDAQPSAARSTLRLLVVGPRLTRDASMLRDLRRQGFQVRGVHTADEAGKAFLASSFDLVLADTHLGRGEGIELIPALQSLPGVSQLPVVLVDDRMRPARREAARRVGAAGYLVQPVRVEAVARGLGRMARGVRGRRYERFPCRLAVYGPGRQESDFTTAVSRMGMFVRTDHELPLLSLASWEVTLPELGRTLRIDAEALYRTDATPPGGPGIGLRLRDFSGEDEACWIDYLGALAQAASAGARS